MKTQEAEALEAQNQQIAKVIPIRTETVLCQYPIHKLSKDKNPVHITLTTENARGKVETTWKVSPNADYGHPGILAYKLDTLFINRLIYELHPNVPEVIKLGDSLNEIGKQLGRKGTRNTAEITNALHQNASAYIKAKLEYVGKDGTRRKFEFGSTRYAVVMIGETLPDGTKAEAVYIVLNPLFRDLLRHARSRPLDYEYLKELPPSAQRWYELVSFQMFAALNLGNPRAKYRYSELCSRAPLATRFSTWNQAKKQLSTIHKPHLKSDYISKVEIEETTDEHGQIDWFLCYTPGKKAKREYREFNERSRLEGLTAKPTPRPRLVEAKSESREGDQPSRSPEDNALIEKLTGYGIDEARTVRLIAKDRAECEIWAAAWPHQNQKGMENPAAVLISFIEKQRRPLPAGYKKAQQAEERKRQHEEEEQKRRAAELHFDYFVPTYREYQRAELLEIEQTRPEEFKEFKAYLEKKFSKALRMVTNEETREHLTLQKASEFFNDTRPELGVTVTTFEEWNEKENPENADPLYWYNQNPAGIFNEFERRLKGSE